MRRFLFALAVLLVATSPTFAGYIIIRVLLEGGNGPGGTSGAPGGTGAGPLAPPTPGGGASGAGPRPPGSGGAPTGAPGTPGGMPSGPATPAVAHGDFDHTRSVVVVIPLEADFLSATLDKTRQESDQNPKFRKFVAPYYGKKLQASLFVDSTSIQFFDKLIGVPAPKKSRTTEMRDKYALWARGKTDPQLLYDAMILALESGIVRDRTLHKDGSPPKDALTFAQELLEVAAEKKSLPPAVDRFVKAWGAVSKDVRASALQSREALEWQGRLDAKDVRVVGHYAIVYWDSSATEVTRRADQLNDNFAGFYLSHATRGTVLPVPTRPLVAVLAKQGQQMRGLNAALDGLPIQQDAFYAPDHDLLVLSPERLDNVGQTFLQQTQQLFVKGLSRDPLLDGQIPKFDYNDKGLYPADVARAQTVAVVELAVDEAEVAAVSREGTRQLLFATNQLPKHVTLPNWLTNGAVNYFARPRGPAYVTIGDDDKPFMNVALSTGFGVPNYVLHRYFRDLDDHKELNADRARLLQNILSDAYFAGIKDGDDPDPAPPVKPKKAGPGGAVPPKTGGPGPGPVPPPMGGPGSLGPKPPMSGGPGPSAPPVGFPPPMGGPGATPTTQDADDPAAMQRKKRDRLAIKAQATAWALYYYLAREKPDQLAKYLAELNKLPRDLPIDGRTAYGVFVRVFGLSAAEGGPADTEKMKKFAKDWLDYVGTVARVGFDIELVAPEPPKESTTGPGTGPGIGPKPPGQPGGPPKP